MRFYLTLLCTIIFHALVMAQSDSNNKYRKLVWADEFNYKGLPDNTKWNYESGFVRNQEPQYYTVKRLENCRVENGMLIIEAKKEQYPNAAYQPGSEKWDQKEKFAHYTSASLITKGKKEWKYGRMEIRAKVPSGLGTWPAFWMLGTDRGPVKWPNCGEIDIMEFLGRDSTRVHGTVHYADSTGTYRHQGEEPVVGKPADGFHIYAIEWNDKQIAFYYDSLKYFVFDYKNTPYPSGQMFQKKYYLLLNLALGHPGAWAGPLDDGALPSKYFIDYVRVYQ
jgi:beta-glucanase (GH16 family)